MDKNKNVNVNPVTEPIFYTVKEMASALQHSEDYVSDMRKGGFRLPATKAEAEAFIREHGPVRRFRNLTRSELYGHPPSPKRASCATGASAKQNRRSRH